MDIVILDAEIANPGDLSWDALAAFGRLSIHSDTPAERVAETIGDAEVAITNKAPLRAEVFEKCKNLRYVGLFSTGYNVVDIAAAKAAGVVVCNVPNYSTAAVAQHTMALLLEICNLVGRHNTAVHAGKWSQSGKWSFWDAALTELDGKTFGAVGFGNIGRAAGRIAAALGMRVLACGSRPTPEGQAVASYVSQAELFAESDVVSLHCPLLPATEKLVNKHTLAQMKDGVILLNTARGGLVSEEDLADALRRGKVSAAGLDVVAIEPIPQSCPLLGLPNCIITPHSAWVPKETRARLFGIATDNLRAFAEGRPQNVVNP